MQRATSIIIGEHYQNMIQSELETGRYTSVSEVIRAALALFEKEQTERTKEAAFWRDVQKGLDSGFKPLDEAKVNLEKSRLELLRSKGLID